MNVILLKVGKSSTARTDQGPCPQERVASVSRSKKEVFQPHLPVRLPCYDLAPVTSFALGRSSRSRTSGAPGFHGLTGGVYKARERIHRAMADARLLANPASRSRPGRKGRADLTSSSPSSHLAVAVPPESPPLRAGNWKQGLRSLWHLSRHLTARADDNHAAPRQVSRRTSTSLSLFTCRSSPGKVPRVSSN